MVTLFLCGDVMTGRGIEQILAHPCPPCPGALPFDTPSGRSQSCADQRPRAASRCRETQHGLGRRVAGETHQIPKRQVVPTADVDALVQG
jgi:hypothetical protein